MRVRSGKESLTVPSLSADAVSVIEPQWTKFLRCRNSALTTFLVTSLPRFVLSIPLPDSPRVLQILVIMLCRFNFIFSYLRFFYELIDLSFVPLFNVVYSSQQILLIFSYIAHIPPTTIHSLSWLFQIFSISGTFYDTCRFRHQQWHGMEVSRLHFQIPNFRYLPLFQNSSPQSTF